MLPRAARLRKERDFRSVFSRHPGFSGARAAVQSSLMLTVHLKPPRGANRADTGELLRFGFSISKKVAKRAHDRNRIKRRLSEIARREIVPAYRGARRMDCVVVARPAAVQADYAALLTDFLALAARAGLELETKPSYAGSSTGSAAE